ncbi:hypothetical protein OZX56_01045 [Lactobacillus sp. ESL0684]|uniref:SLAP domain-containing protein n=1 Tax=Lactobacillus sp. ESL0684 TaxID=2983213 RepID=UPI0023F8B5C9|nr:SLAP domain-containing protein [Lactobacillus sp. ESL0684]WEV43856.1 hypothetical protein OZX56_01045 [Lactobacillus sp. ESL0684]
MKKFQKLGMFLAALLLGISPIISTVQPETVQAKKAIKYELETIDDPFIYKSNGKRYRYYHEIAGYGAPDINSDGYAYIDSEETGEVTYTGKTKKIKGKKYYQLAKNAYIKAVNVASVNGKNVQKGKLLLNHASQVYNQTGKKTAKVLANNTLVKYVGKIKKTNKMPKYFYYQYLDEGKTEQCYLPIHRIKGEDFYSLGKNRYIKAINVARIDGYVARYNGVVSAIVRENTSTTSFTGVKALHKLKKGQKIKLDLSFTQDDEDGDYYDTCYRLHDYPNEYIDDWKVKIRNEVPIVNYNDIALRKFTAVSNEPLKLYDNQAVELSKPLTPAKDETVSVDGLFYLWNKTQQKAELYYHVLRQTNEQIPATDPNRLTFSNGFVKASDIKLDNDYVKLEPVNTEQEAEADQAIATADDKKELLQLFKDGQNNLTGDNVNYENALANAAKVLNSASATKAEVKEVVWLVKTTKR